MAALSTLQLRVLALVQAVEPAPLLFGGAAILGLYCDHRSTRDLDLQWQPCDNLSQVTPQVQHALAAAGLVVAVIQRSPTFVRLRAALHDEVVLLDLVAHPGRARTDTCRAVIGDVPCLALTLQGALTDKLGALLSRQEGRDLDDIAHLLAAGGDLAQALADAPNQDAGFSCMTVAWLLRGWRMEAVALASGWSPAKMAEMTQFRDQLVEQLAASV